MKIRGRSYGRQRSKRFNRSSLVVARPLNKFSPLPRTEHPTEAQTTVQLILRHYLDQTGLAPVVFPGLISVAAVSHAAPPSLAGVGTVQKQPTAACVFALTDQTARSGGEKIGCCSEDGIKQIVRTPRTRSPGPANLRSLNGQTSPGATIVQLIANPGKCVRRDRIIACNCMENRKQLFADGADAPQRRGPHQGAGVDCSPVRQLSLASPPLHILGTLQMVLLLPGIRSKCDRVDEIEREVSGDKLISVIPAVHGDQYKPYDHILRGYVNLTA